MREWHRMMRRTAEVESGYLLLFLMLICLAWGFGIGFFTYMGWFA